MRIKYTGTKQVKIVERSRKIYKFDPYCIVEDPDVIEFLLSPDMKGLFIVAKEVIDDIYATDNKDEIVEEEKSFKCSICGFEAKNKTGLSAHIRGKHKI